MDALMEELLTQGGAETEQDLAWLYSDAEESAEPSGLVGEPAPAPALPGPGEGRPRAWDPRWRRFALGNYILTGTAIAIGAAASFIPAKPGQFEGRNDVDEWGREHLGYDGYEEGRWARDLSDVTLSVSVTYPLLIDSLIITYWYRKSHDVAGQMALISAEGMSVATALQSPVASLTNRERPYGRDCGTTIDANRSVCTSDRRYRSFFSGHTALSFAGAGASCMNHITHSVFGDATADGLSCGAGFAVAATAGFMRIVGRQHYISDVGLGAVVGTLSGMGVPWLLHYGPLARTDGKDSAFYNLRLFAMKNGIGIQGDFR